MYHTGSNVDDDRWARATRARWAKGHVTQNERRTATLLRERQDAGVPLTTAQADFIATVSRLTEGGR
jgi:hypothetical protein